MAKDVLIEIGLEEMPAHVVVPSMNQLEAKVATFFEEQHLSYDNIRAYSTPRRLAVLIEAVPERQADIEEEIKGPAKKIALDAEGNWSKAAQGFVRGQGLTTDDITFKELNGVEYVYATKKTTGKQTIDVLTGLKEVITSLTFPVTMHWNKYDFEYIRPIHWVVALFGEEVIPFEILDVKTDRHSRGHRFLGHEVTFKRAHDYVETLAEQSVIADSAERQQLIVNQISAIAEKNKWQVFLDEDLLEEVTNLVEYPTAFVGNFAKQYLEIPEEVLVTSMKEHQRYFDVRTEDGQLLPHFISVRNGNDVAIENVIKGNEKVLKARLEDAEFFYQEDQKLTIAACVEKLKHVAFHEKIGSIYEKMTRVGVIAQIIGETVGLSSAELTDLQRASEIYKFDLVTNMVDEFPELQGIMGEKYALLQGEKASVAAAIREHYLPIASEGELPESVVGSVLAIADKVDSVLTFFAAGMVPSGSNDPYALRRQTYGIIRIIEAKQWHFPFEKLQRAIQEKINEDQATYGTALSDENNLVSDFLKARLRQRLATRNIRHDVIEAVLASEQKDVSRLLQAAELVSQHLADQEFKPSMEALTRVMNLAKKQETKNSDIQPDLFENEAEKALFEAVTEVEANFATNTMAENYQALVALRPAIEAYFDQTMVMVDDASIRANRLALLAKISKMVLAIASLDQLVTK